MPNPNHTPWSPEEVDRLRDAYSRWPVDLSPFIDAGRTRQAVQTYASKRGITNCRLVPRPFTNVTDTEWAYLAGFVDGEGTIFMKHSSARYVLVVNTDEKVIEWIKERWPGYGKALRPPKEGERKKPLHYLAWTRRDALLAMLDGLIPFLVTKQDKAEQLRAFVLSGDRTPAEGGYQLNA